MHFTYVTHFLHRINFLCVFHFIWNTVYTSYIPFLGFFAWYNFCCFVSLRFISCYMIQIQLWTLISHIMFSYLSCIPLISFIPLFHCWIVQLWTISVCCFVQLEKPSSIATQIFAEWCGGKKLRPSSLEFEGPPFNVLINLLVAIMISNIYIYMHVLFQITSWTTWYEPASGKNESMRGISEHESKGAGFKMSTASRKLGK